MREWEALFHFKKPDPARLLAFGFRESGNQFLWETPINEGQFLLRVVVDKGQPDYSLTDPATGEEYTLIKSEAAQGHFVTALRELCRQELARIAAACFITDTFQAEQAGGSSAISANVMMCSRNTFGKLRPIPQLCAIRKP